MDQETWRFINTFAPWLSAIGTLSAVVTSLYLARQSNRIKMELRVGLRRVGYVGGQPMTEPVAKGATPTPPLLFWLNITNLGHRGATIDKVYWKLVPWSKRGLIWFPPQNSYSSAFPITLGDGQSASYAIPVPEFESKQGETLRSELSHWPRGIRSRLLRVCVATSTGDVFKQKLERDMRQLLKAVPNEGVG